MTSVEGAFGMNTDNVERASAKLSLVERRTATDSTFQLKRSVLSPSDTSSG